jgi:hypothetical protein
MIGKRFSKVFELVYFVRWCLIRVRPETDARIIFTNFTVLGIDPSAAECDVKWVIAVHSPFQCFDRFPGRVFADTEDLDAKLLDFLKLVALADVRVC